MEAIELSVLPADEITLEVGTPENVTLTVSLPEVIELTAGHGETGPAGPEGPPGPPSYIAVDSDLNAATSLVLLVKGMAETVVLTAALDPEPLFAELVAQATVSADDFGQTKQATFRVRRDGLAGAVLSAWQVPSFANDSKTGNVFTTNVSVYDDAPTTGTYVFTVQVTTGSANTEIWSASRRFDLLGYSGTGDPGPAGPPGEAGPAGPGVAAGGTTGQALVKASGTDYDTAWASAVAPLPHASTHGSAGTDPVTITQSQVTGLTTALASYLPLTGGTMTAGAFAVQVYPDAAENGMLNLRNPNPLHGARLNLIAASGTPEFRGQRSGGTVAAPAPVGAGAGLARMFGTGWNGAIWANGPRIDFLTSEAWDATHTGSRMSFYATDIGTTNQLERMRITGSTVQVGGTLTDAVGVNERLRINTPTTVDALGAVLLSPSGTTIKPLVVQALAGQTAHLTEWQDSAGASLASVKSNGTIGLGADVDLYRAGADLLRLPDSAMVGRGNTNGVSGTSTGPDLYVAGAGFRDQFTAGNLQVFATSTSNLTADQGASINLGGAYGAAGANSPFARIVGAKENSTAEDFAGALTLWTRPMGGSLTERLRISSVGIVTIPGQLGLGPVPATNANGAVRLSNNTYIAWRKADNSANSVSIGETAVGTLAVTVPNGGIDFTVGGVQSVIMGSNLLRLLEATNVQLGTVTGTKIGTTALQKLGFFNATPVVQPTATPAAATDPATTMALANDLRAKLISLGLIA